MNSPKITFTMYKNRLLAFALSSHQHHTWTLPLPRLLFQKVFGRPTIKITPALVRNWHKRRVFGAGSGKTPNVVTEWRPHSRPVQLDFERLERGSRLKSVPDIHAEIPITVSKASQLEVVGIYEAKMGKQW